jgi:hypothetical protein
MNANRKRYTKLLLGIVFLGVVVFFSYGDSLHAEIVQKIAPRDQGSNGPEGIESADPPDTNAADVFPPFDVDSGALITGINYKFNSTQDLVDAFSGASKKFSQPSVDITLSSSNIQPGESTGILAKTQNFDSLYTDQYFSWCLGTKENRITQNGLAAGGTRIPIEGNGPDCYTKLQRSPSAAQDTDDNHDGIGDNWAARYFNTINIDPNADPDHDGFAMNEENSIVGPKGIIKLVPDVKVGNVEYVTGDGKFPNAEEWVWGTNPIDPDSDDDGFVDEEDIAGKGQISFQYSPPKDSKIGDSEFLELIGDGYANYREDNGETKLAKISNAGMALFVGNGETLKGSLEYRVINDTTQDPTTLQNLESQPEDIYAEDEIELHAVIDGSQDDELNLHYQWSFKLIDGGVDFPHDPGHVLDTIGPLPAQYAITDNRLGKAGFGLNPYRLKIGEAATTVDGTGFNIAPKTGNKIVAEVAVIEPETGKRADIIEEFPIATSVTLEFSPELPIQPLYPQADLASAPTYTVTAEVPGLATKDFLYEWYIDEEKQPNSKIGGNTMSFKATKQSGEYKISVILTRVADEKIFAQAIANAIVSPLRVSITNCPDFENKENLSAGIPIALQSTIVAQGTFPGTLEYQWFLNGEPLTQASSEQQPTVTFIPQTIGSYNVTYKAESVPPAQATTTPYVPLSISATCKISVVNGPSVTTAQSISRLLASVVFAFPAVLRGVLTFFGIIFLIFAIIYLVRNQKHKKTQ